MITENYQILAVGLQSFFELAAPFNNIKAASIIKKFYMCMGLQ
jgi:hypothetical protein